MGAGVLEANPYASELVNAIVKASFIYVKKRATPRCQREFLLQVKVGWITFRKQSAKHLLFKEEATRTNRIASDINNVPTKSAKDKGYYMFWVFNDDKIRLRE